ncbi:Histidine-specific methyltransferase EgtD [Maioricimonas rarisocia]|uniref:Histidine-specific methyltransferase EgtD n=1 Tax=Maioricimonas rarisocia TaxID=2528026 RepID=A0A517ZCX5_9PLAN|nr:L-histidine N(alpha)-methyltransferase [Maioricimonas rarisocia]QDU40317.1 Histidine-specific methyltransferase EgtD [Maioricimonas rarisocia]
MREADACTLSETTSSEITETSQQFLEDVIRGLSQSLRTLPCKYLYDHRGSHLFDAICELDEYYPTRTELNIMRESVDEMAERIGPEAGIVEYGSGSSLKTELLLEALDSPVAYVPVDISDQHLHAAAERMSELFPDVDIIPIHADFTDRVKLPEFPRRSRRISAYFPGSTIGNFTPEEAAGLLGRIAETCHRGGGLLIGFDLQKDVRILEAAYDDAEGVTARFNLNLLERINRELDADFNLEQFRHRAIYNREHNRVEMHLESLKAQSVTVGGREFAFEAGETICTEHSHKYTIDGFSALAASAGLQLAQYWTDPQQLFAVAYLDVV